MKGVNGLISKYTNKRNEKLQKDSVRSGIFRPCCFRKYTEASLL